MILYDLLFNSLKMEQRIDRCHRLGQENNVLSGTPIQKESFADVRKLELMSKWTLVSESVFGISDEVMGGLYRRFGHGLPSRRGACADARAGGGRLSEDADAA